MTRQVGVLSNIEANGHRWSESSFVLTAAKPSAKHADVVAEALEPHVGVTPTLCKALAELGAEG